MSGFVFLVGGGGWRFSWLEGRVCFFGELSAVSWAGEVGKLSPWCVDRAAQWMLSYGWFSGWVGRAYDWLVKVTGLMKRKSMKSCNKSGNQFLVWVKP